MITQSHKPKRGGCLTIFLVLMLVGNLMLGLVYLFTGLAFADIAILQGSPVSPSWFVPFLPLVEPVSEATIGLALAPILLLGLLSIANFVFALAIWKWKKWGMYGFVGSSLIVFVINVLKFGIVAGLLGLIGVAILAFLVRPTWDVMKGDTL